MLKLTGSRGNSYWIVFKRDHLSGCSTQYNEVSVQIIFVSFANCEKLETAARTQPSNAMFGF